MAKAAILGFGTEGKTAAKYWFEKGYDIEIRDTNDSIASGISSEYTSRLGEGYLASLETFDVIVRSPGVHPDEIVSANNNSADILNKVTTSINEFLTHVPTKNIIGVTGTKGKGTTATIITKLLEAADKTVHFGGNIGVTLLDKLPEISETDYVVIELSSFQLYDLKHSIPSAVCLKVSPEHLNWHKDEADYFWAKANLFRNQTEASLAIWNAYSETSKKIASESPGRKLAYAVPKADDEPITRDAAYVESDSLFYKETTIISLDEIAIPGRHNLENICAAVSAVWPIIGDAVDVYTKVLSSFTGLDNHLELIREVDGVKYYNDTYATAPDAAVAAMHAISEDKIMILGGIDKGLDLSPMVDEVVAANVPSVVLIDDLAESLQQQFRDRGFENAFGCSTMNEAVEKAHRQAEAGMAVLLSPGCAGNGGLFTDKNDRGRQFNQAVQGLGSK